MGFVKSNAAIFICTCAIVSTICACTWWLQRSLVAVIPKSAPDYTQGFTLLDNQLFNVVASTESIDSRLVTTNDELKYLREIVRSK